MKRLNVFFLLAVLFGTLSLSLSAQELIPLRDYTMQKWYKRKDGKRPYFYDKEHDLDKFVGVWEGMSWNGYQLRAELSLIKRYDEDEYQIDLLALDLQVKKDGKPVTTYLDLDKQAHKLLGLRLIPSSRFSADGCTPWAYSIPLYFQNDIDLPYNGWHTTAWVISTAYDTLTVWTQHLASQESRVRFPEYATPRGAEAPIWTLRRVR